MFYIQYFQGSVFNFFQGSGVSGTTIKFQPLEGQDTIMKTLTLTNVKTKHQCITAVKEYENKSLEVCYKFCQDYIW